MKGLLRAAKTNSSLLDPAPATQAALQKKIAAAKGLAGRELAAEAAANLPQEKRVDIGATVVLPPFEDAPQSAAFTVEHGRAIDKAFIGKKKHVRFDEAAQELVPDKTHETFEEMNGLTRAYVNFIWEPEMITDVPKRDAER